MSSSVLEQELRTFEAHKPELVASSLGKYALVYRDQITLWETYQDALQAGYEQFGPDEPFMVRKVKDAEAVHLLYRGSVAER